MTIAECWSRLRAGVRQRRTQLALSIRVTIAAVVALILAQWLNLPLPLWAVLTAVIVTQMSFGRSLKATFDYLLGTLGGAVYGGAIAALIPHAGEIPLLLVLAAALTPLALVAAINPRFSAAPITGIIVLLVPLMTHVTPLASAFDRVMEVAVGGVIGLVVSFLFLRLHAHSLVAERAASILDLMARALGELLTGLTRDLDVEAQHYIQDDIGRALLQMNEAGAEAEHERAAGLGAGPDTGPLLRTSLRLRHDLVMIGRAATGPLPVSVRARLKAPLEGLGSAIAVYLHSGAAALRSRRQPARLEPVEQALNSYIEEVAALRADGLTRGLSAEEAERFFALGFAFEQMRSNLADLHRVVAEWAQ